MTALKLVYNEQKKRDVFYNNTLYNIIHYITSVMAIDIVSTLCRISDCKLHNRSGRDVITNDAPIWLILYRMVVLYNCDSHYWTFHCNGPFCTKHFRIHSIHFNVCLSAIVNK